MIVRLVLVGRMMSVSQVSLQPWETISMLWVSVTSEPAVPSFQVVTLYIRGWPTGASKSRAINAPGEATALT